MKILMTIMLLMTSVAALSACQATARDDDGYVSVGTNDSNNNGNFCPPGQAKKGRC